MKTKPISELEVLSSDAIDRYRCELQQDLNDCIKSQETIEQNILQLQEQILTIQLAKKKLEQHLSTAKYNTRQLSIHIKIAESKFWAVKGDRR